MGKCTFDEIYTAYESSSLLALFDATGLKAARKFFRNLEDVLSETTVKSVWHLKRIVVIEDGELIPHALVDYGFANCKTEVERLELREVYRRVFHRAVGWDLLDPVKMKKKDKETIKRLMYEKPIPFRLLGVAYVVLVYNRGSSDAFVYIITYVSYWDNRCITKFWR